MIGKNQAGRWNGLCQELQGDPQHPLASLGVCVIQGGQEIYRGAHGYGQFSSSGHQGDIRFSCSQLIRIASVSKLVTAVALAPLIAAGKLDLQQDISQLLDQSIRHPDHPDHPIRLWHLLTHTSLLTDAQRYAVPLQKPLLSVLDDPERWLRAGQYLPGQCFNYCNLNFALVGSILERVSGRRFDAYLRASLLAPLGIPGGFNLAVFSEDEMQHLMPVHQWQQGTWVPQVDDWRGRVPCLEELPCENPDVGGGGQVLGSPKGYVLGSNGSAFSPQGGLRTSVDGLSRLAYALLDKGELAHLRVALDQLFWESDGLNFINNGDGLFTQVTLGSQRVLLPDGSYLWGHAGAAYGLLSGFYLHPTSRSALVWVMGGVSIEDSYLINSSGISGFTKWETELIRFFVDQF